jgi:hypothetical protein
MIRKLVGAGMAPMAQHMAVSLWLTVRLPLLSWRLRRRIVPRGEAPKTQEWARAGEPEAHHQVRALGAFVFFDNNTPIGGPI